MKPCKLRNRTVSKDISSKSEATKGSVSNHADKLEHVVEENGPNAYAELGKSKVKNKGGVTLDKINIENLLLLRKNSEVCNSMEPTNKDINLDKDATTTMQQMEEVYAEEDQTKKRKRDKLPIKGGKTAFKNKNREPFESSKPSAKQTAKGKEKIALKIINKDQRELHLTEGTFKMFPSVPNNSVIPATTNRSTPHASHRNGLYSRTNPTTVQFPSANFPIHMPTLGIHPFHVGVGNQGLNWGRIMPLSNGIYGPHHQGSSLRGFHSLQPLASAHLRELNTNFNSMAPHLLSVQTLQTPALSFSATTTSPPTNAEIEARPQFLLGGRDLPPKNVTLNKNAGRVTDNTK